MRGIKITSATRIAAELGDLRRFTRPRQLMGFVGLVSSEHSSGRRQHRGSVTKTGNAHVRHILVQAAWHSRHPPSLSTALRKRQCGQSERVIGHCLESTGSAASALSSSGWERQTPAKGGCCGGERDVGISLSNRSRDPAIGKHGAGRLNEEQAWRLEGWLARWVGTAAERRTLGRP
jgi:hypothetical protein